ncbi:magnesium transporter, partial [Candidatus Woesearchaeota archaeon]|nr:magnesium transporter [Candidatus Woesearchaeota archaeon]
NTNCNHNLNMKKIINSILKESFKLVIIASTLSSIGGMGIQLIQDKLIAILPLLIIFPVLNDMVGNFGTIISANFTTLLFTNQLKAKWRSKKLKELVKRLLIIALFSAILLGVMGNLIAYLKGFPLSATTLLKVLIITITCTLLLVSLICLISISAGFYYYHLKEDPDNKLIALSTSIADLGTMILFAVLINLLF